MFSAVYLSLFYKGDNSRPAVNLINYNFNKFTEASENIALLVEFQRISQPDGRVTLKELREYTLAKWSN